MTVYSFYGHAPVCPHCSYMCDVSPYDNGSAGEVAERCCPKCFNIFFTEISHEIKMRSTKERPKS